MNLLTDIKKHIRTISLLSSNRNLRAAELRGLESVLVEMAGLDSRKLNKFLSSDEFHEDYIDFSKATEDLKTLIGKNRGGDDLNSSFQDLIYASEQILMWYEKLIYISSPAN